MLPNIAVVEPIHPLPDEILRDDSHAGKPVSFEGGVLGEWAHTWLF